MLEDLEKYEDLKKFLQLHKSIKKVKGTLDERKEAIKGLRSEFKDLDGKIKTFSKDQNKTTVYPKDDKPKLPNDS